MGKGRVRRQAGKRCTGWNLKRHVKAMEGISINDTKESSSNVHGENPHLPYQSPVCLVFGTADQRMPSAAKEMSTKMWQVSAQELVRWLQKRDVKLVKNK
jgi:hypothetical protein